MSVLHSVLRLLVVAFLASSTCAQDAAFEMAPIATTAPNSATFAFVRDKSCDASVVTVVYELYAKNTMVFQRCVSEGQYKIFPFTGSHPTPQQIGGMARSLACRAIFASILLAGIPNCELSNFPMRAAAETLLKIGVDIDKYPKSNNVVPSTTRFLEMMRWRRSVNLAQAAGLPCDSESQLYAEYSSNLYTITTNGLVRLTADKEVQYRSTINGSFGQEQIVQMPNMPGLRDSGSGGKITTVYAAEPASSMSSDGIETHAELKSNATKSANVSETEKTFMSDATSTSAAARVNWSQARVAAVAVTIVMLIMGYM